MDDHFGFQVTKLVLETIVSWPFIGLTLTLVLFVNRQVLANLPNYVSKFKVGEVEIELREIRKKLEETQDKLVETTEEIEELKHEVDVRWHQIADGMNPHAPVSAFREARQELKAIAPTLTNIDEQIAALQPGTSVQKLLAAAEVIRARRDILAFDPLVDCLARLAESPTLEGNRLIAVWTLVSALHRIVMDDVRRGPASTLTEAQLNRTLAMLDRLDANPRVQDDRPDNPKKGIRGPTSWTRNWIARARNQPGAAVAGTDRAA